MADKFISYLVGLVTLNKRAVWYRTLFVLIFILPVVALTILSYSKIYRESTVLVISQKKALAFLAATIVHERLDAAVDIGVSLATRPTLVEFIEKGDWVGATDILNGVLINFPFVDRILLMDTSAIIKASMPSFPDFIDQSRADREWYRILKSDWKPHVSGIYKRGTPPQINVVSVLVPIKTLPPVKQTQVTSTVQEERVLGIMQLQLKLDAFREWFEKVDVGPGGLIYIVDEHGQLIYHPKYDVTRELVDFSSVPIVQKVLQGISGAELNYNPVEQEERAAAYAPVLEHKWGVVVTQPAKAAFVGRNKSLTQFFFTYGALVFLSLFLALLVLYIIVTHKKAEAELKKAQEELRELSLADPLTDLYNRRGLDALGEQQLKVAKRNNQDVSLFFIDMDNMKAINDDFGHAEGDAALVAVAGLLRASFREADIIARLGGDEFVVFATLTNNDDPQILIERLEKNISVLNEKRVPRHKLYVSIGLSRCVSGNVCNLQNMIGEADKMMYVQKWTKKSD